MKIFISHSSRQKLFVKELKKHIPENINLWIDEKELLIGENYGDTIQEEIQDKCDFVIIIIDSHAIKSEWVLREFSWSIKREKTLGRVFILPVVLELDAWQQITDPDMKNRKYLQCLDYMDESIKNLGHNIILELFGWLSKEMDRKSHAATEQHGNNNVLQQADLFSAKLADNIMLEVFPYRRETPLDLEKLHSLIQRTNDFSNIDYEQFIKLLERLQNQDYLSGIICDGINIFIEEEHISWKIAAHSTAKKRIAKKALSFIKSGHTIAMDAGSSTLEVAKQIGNGLRMKAWKDLTIVTNSLSVANELLNVSSEMGWDDSNALAKIYIIGGRIRPNTLAVVNDDMDFKLKVNDAFKNFLTLFGNADISFIGCNGIHYNSGFTTHNSVELYTKTDIMSFSKRNFVLSDPSKFGIKEDKVFATFDDNIEVITIKDGFEESVNSYTQFLQNKNAKILLA